MTNWLMLAQVRLLNAYASIRDREEGQGTTEYVVLLVGVIAIAGAVTAALQTQLVTKLTAIISGI